MPWVSWSKTRPAWVVLDSLNASVTKNKPWATSSHPTGCRGLRTTTSTPTAIETTAPR